MSTKFLFFMTGIAIIVILGTAGYMYLEGWTVLESLYMTVITITTVGFEEVHRLSPRRPNIYDYSDFHKSRHSNVRN